MTAATAAGQARQGHAWQISDVVRLYGLDAAALVVLLTGWWAAAGTVRTTTQIGCIAAGVAAVIVAGSANCLWLLAGRRAVAGRRRAVGDKGELLTRALLERGVDPLGTGGLGTGPRPAFLVLPGSHRYHRADCPLVAGKPGVKALRVTGVNGRQPCGVCAP